MKKVHGVPFRIVLAVSGAAWTLNGDQSTLAYREDPDIEPWFYDGDVLEQFLAVRTEPEVLAFLNRLGTYFYSDSTDQDPTDPWQPGLASIADFFEWQTIVKKLMVKPPTSWGFLTQNPVEPFQMDFPDGGTSLKIEFGGFLATLDFLKADAIVNSFRLPLNFVWQSNGRHYLRIETTDILKAIMAKIGLDHVSRTINRLCQRPDCEKHFVLKTKRTRKYCSPECAHVMAMRANRARAAKKKKLAKAQKKKTAKKALGDGITK